MEGGLTELNDIYLASLQKLYQTTVTSHVIMFVLAIVLALSFYFLMLRPYMNVREPGGGCAARAARGGAAAWRGPT